MILSREWDGSANSWYQRADLFNLDDLQCINAIDACVETPGRLYVKTQEIFWMNANRKGGELFLLFGIAGGRFAAHLTLVIAEGDDGFAFCAMASFLGW